MELHHGGGVGWVGRGVGPTTLPLILPPAAALLLLFISTAELFDVACLFVSLIPQKDALRRPFHPEVNSCTCSRAEASCDQMKEFAPSSPTSRPRRSGTVFSTGVRRVCLIRSNTSGHEAFRNHRRDSIWSNEKKFPEKPQREREIKKHATHKS